MKLSNVCLCENCESIVKLNKHGRCPECNGDAVEWLSNLLEGKQKKFEDVRELEKMYSL